MESNKILRWRQQKRYVQGCPPLRPHGFIKFTPLEGLAASPPWWWFLLYYLCFLCGFWLVTRQLDKSYQRFRGVTKWATQACTIPPGGSLWLLRPSWCQHGHLPGSQWPGRFFVIPSLFIACILSQKHLKVEGIGSCMCMYCFVQELDSIIEYLDNSSIKQEYRFANDRLASVEHPARSGTSTSNAGKQEKHAMSLAIINVQRLMNGVTLVW